MIVPTIIYLISKSMTAFKVSFFIIWGFFTIAVLSFFGQESYNFVNQLFSFSIIKFALFLFTWVFFHHLFGGIRHFIWDFGLGFDLNSIEWLARLTALFSFLSASLLWLL